MEAAIREIDGNMPSSRATRWPPGHANGASIAADPTAPVAFTGVWPIRSEELPDYLARRSRRHPVPSGGRSGASTFPSVLAVPRSDNPWGLGASSAYVPVETFAFTSTLSRGIRPPVTCPRASFTGTRPFPNLRPKIFALRACFQVAQLSPPRRNFPSLLLPFQPCGFPGFGRAFPLR